jgi:hypothetical protein
MLYVIQFVSGFTFLKTDNIRFEFYKTFEAEARLTKLRIQSVPQREHNTSPLYKDQLE